MKRRLVVLVTLLGCFGIATAQTADDDSERLSYYLPYQKIGSDAAVISIVNAQAHPVNVTVTIEDDYGNRLDTLSDRLAPSETRSFPASSLPPGGTRLHLDADARVQVGMLYVRDGIMFETRIVEPEREAVVQGGITESDDRETDGKHLAARAAITVTYGSTCGGQTSNGNPYPCGSGGNCTWWAWKMAKDNWGVSLPGWGNAATWATSARNANYRVTSTPAPQTIGVNTTMLGDLGHVFWVTSVNGSQVCGTEMLWGSYGMRSNCYAASTFNAGFIYPPSLTVVSPNGWEHWSSGSKRTISWSSTGDPGGYVRIELLEYGMPSSVIASSVPRGQTTGSFTWTVPWVIPASGYTVRITSTSNSKYADVSNAAFTIW